MILRLLYLHTAYFYYCWAQREIQPDHEDAHHIYRRISELNIERNAL